MNGVEGRQTADIADLAAPCHQAQHRHAGRLFWVVWLLVAALATVLSVEARSVAYFPGDLSLARWTQGLGLPVIGGLLGAESTIGSPLWALAIIAVISAALLLWRFWWAAAIFAATNALWAADALLKWLVARPRPSPNLVHVAAHASDASFPSGHVFSAVLLYGILIVVLERLPLAPLPRRLGQALAVVVLLGMGPARIYAGAHWPSDVLGAYLWAGLLLALVLRLTHVGRAVPWHHLHQSAPLIPPQPLLR